MYIYRILTVQPLRLMLTLSGIALCIILILFILGIYNGVAEGSIQYVKQNKADMWVLQSNTTNIMRGTSILPVSYHDIIKQDSAIESADPVLALLTNLKAGEENTTVLLTGYVPGCSGGPPGIAEGRNITGNHEIVLDRAYAKKYKIKIGGEVSIRNNKLQVVGLSSGTNAFVTQYAFVTFDFVQSIVETGGLVSFFIINAKPGSDLNKIKNNIETRLHDRVSVYYHDQFLENNIKEIDSGILPLFYAIAVIGGIVLAIILTLILSVNILERRKDFAVMKILGSGSMFLNRLIMMQSLIISFSAEIIGVVLFFPVVNLIETISPEVTTLISAEHIICITVITLFISIFSSLVSSRRIRKIYPAEVFS